jgi:glycosyltransferase involved in cell wall biosynthesis
MRVAFCIRDDYAARIGGDTVQLLRTKERLERSHGIRGDIVTDESRLSKTRYDLCHVFNLQSLSKTVRFVDRARRHGLKVALSTIYWDFGYSKAYESLVRLGHFGISESRIRWMMRIKKAEAGLFNRKSYFSTAYRSQIGGILRQCDALLPNSGEELGILSRVAGIPLDELRPRSSVVFNAADPEGTVDGGAEAEPFPGTEGIRGKYVLQVGRIEPCKNQYSLIRSLFDDRDIPIVIVGNPQADPRYFAGVKALAERRGNVRFFGHLPQESLPRLYRNAAVHALPSLRESPGLASLEALSNGCKAVVSEKRFCPVETYFQNSVTTVNPLNVRSIHEGILREIGADRDRLGIKNRILGDFTWEKAARQTRTAYVNAVPASDGNPRNPREA